MRCHSQTVIDGEMKTACVLHNMLLVADGQDQFAWETLNPDSNENDDAEVGLHVFDALDIHPMDLSGNRVRIFNTAIIGKCIIAK